jgi:NADH dehydrogenase
MNITIVGGGFGGVKAALELGKDDRNHITLITDKDTFQYYPALFNTMTGKSHAQAWIPLGIIFADKKNIDIIIDTIEKIDKPGQTITSTTGKVYSYETLILALGNVTTYFGIEGLDKFAYGIKSFDEIRDLKDHIHQELMTKDDQEKHYVIIGAGPTGVELSASLRNYIDSVREHYKAAGEYSIDVIEAMPRVLPKMNEKVSAKVLKRMQSLGLNVMTEKKVEKRTSDSLQVSGEQIKTGTVIWTSGVANHPFFAANPDAFQFSPNKHIVVDDHLKSSANIYVIGDNAFTPFSGLAQTALRDAVFVAKNIKRDQDGQPMLAYKAVMPPVVVPVGKGWAVFSWKKIVLTGWVASLIRRAADLIGYHDILSWSRAISIWAASESTEGDYFDD